MSASIIRLESVDSTNLYVRKGLLDGTLSGRGVVVSRTQTEGRGRYGRAWHSDNELGLWATLYFTPGGLKVHDMVSAVSKAVSRALASRGVSAKVKFPNDLVVGKRKICGILAETFPQGALAGVGVNLNQSASDFPGEIREMATSFLIEKGEIWPVDDFLERFLTECGDLETFAREK